MIPEKNPVSLTDSEQFGGLNKSYLIIDLFFYLERKFPILTKIGELEGFLYECLIDWSLFIYLVVVVVVVVVARVLC